MKHITLSIPETLDISAGEIAMIVAARLYEQGKLSLGQAADVAGITKRLFMERLGDYGVSVFNYPASDLVRDVRNA